MVSINQLVNFLNVFPDLVQFGQLDAILFLFYRRDGGRFATLDIGTDPYTKDSPSFNTRAERETSKW